MAAGEHVEREPTQPGREARFAAKRRELLPRPDEYVLGQGLGLRGVEHPGGQRVDRRGVAAVDPGERRGVTGHGE